MLKLIVLFLTATVCQSLSPSAGAGAATEVETLPVVTLESWNSPAAPAATTTGSSGRIQAVYDQNDTIYLLAPTPNGQGVKILPYSVSNDSYETPAISWIIPQPKMEGSAVWGGTIGSDTIYYLEGGLGQPSKVWKFTLTWRRPTSPFAGGGGARYYEVKQLGTLQESHPTQGSLVSDGDEYVYIIGGIGRARTGPSDKIYRISMATDGIDEVVRMPLPRADVKAVYDKDSGSIFIFSGLLPVLKYETKEGSFDTFTLQPPQRTPEIVDGALKQVVWVRAGGFALLFYSHGPTSPGADNGVNGQGWILTKWNPLNPEELQPIELGLREEPFVKEDCTAVYVEKLDRVYIFCEGGGDLRKETTAYIDLSQVTSNLAPRPQLAHAFGILPIVASLLCFG